MLAYDSTAQTTQGEQLRSDSTLQSLFVNSIGEHWVQAVHSRSELTEHARDSHHSRLPSGFRSSELHSLWQSLHCRFDVGVHDWASKIPSVHTSLQTEHSRFWFGEQAVVSYSSVSHWSHTLQALSPRGLQELDSYRPLGQAPPQGEQMRSAVSEHGVVSNVPSGHSPEHVAQTRSC